jgi:hypothetical protein
VFGNERYGSEITMSPKDSVLPGPLDGIALTIGDTVGGLLGDDDQPDPQNDWDV